MSVEIENLSILRYSSNDYAEALRNCRIFWNMESADASLLRFLENPGCLMLSATVNGEPAGQLLGYFLRRWDSSASMLFLYSIDVAEKYRRKGIGKKLVAEFNRIGIEEGCSETFVLTDDLNNSAMNLYQSAGGIRVFPNQVMFIWNHNQSASLE